MNRQVVGDLSAKYPYSDTEKTTTDIDREMDLPDADGDDGRCSTCLASFSQETSFAGLKYIGKKGSSLRRLIWFAVVLLALAGLLYQIIVSTQRYIERPSNTKISFDKRDFLEFPSVTICNTNMFRSDRLAEEYGGWLTFIFEGINKVRCLFPQLGLLENRHNIQFGAEEPYPGNKSLLEFIVKNGPSKEKTIIKCHFNGQKCGTENFTTTITNYGVCFTFNSIQSNQSLPIRIPGELHGLSVILNTDQSTHVAVPRENAGFKVLVHPKDEFPNLQDFGFELQVGTHAVVRIGTKELNLLPHPYSKCTKEENGKLEYLAGKYTQSKCLLECETKYILDNCNCTTFYMPGDAQLCKPFDLVNCFQRFRESFNMDRDEICRCEESCKQTVYHTSISQSTFPSKSVAITFSMQTDFYYRNLALNQAITTSAVQQFGESAHHMSVDMSRWFEKLTNSANVSIREYLPTAFNNGLIHVWYMEVQYEIFFILSETFIDYPITSHSSYGSATYNDSLRNVTNKYLSTDVIKSLFMDGVEVEYKAGAKNVTLTEYADNLYTMFNIQDAFASEFPKRYATSYQATYKILTDFGRRIFEDSDLLTLQTNYMRDNLVHADIFFGDLKVEEIKEQQEYFFFQYICDWGGVLGLFFGASLLSFVETIDFCCFRNRNRNKEN